MSTAPERVQHQLDALRGYWSFRSGALRRPAGCIADNHRCSCACADAIPTSWSSRRLPEQHREALAAVESVPPISEDGPAARINLRLPEQLKAAVEEAAAKEGRSVNAWLVRAAAAALQSDHPLTLPRSWAGSLPRRSAT